MAWWDYENRLLIDFRHRPCPRKEDGLILTPIRLETRPSHLGRAAYQDALHAGPAWQPGGAVNAAPPFSFS